MELTIKDMPEPPEGYEYTGEYRYHADGHQCITIYPFYKKKRFRAKDRCEFWYVGPDGDVYNTKDYEMETDNNKHDIGNYFETEAEAQKAADKLKEFFMQFHGGE
jgi:hypothetical protein